MNHRRWVFLAIPLVAVASLSACADDPSYDPAKVESFLVDRPPADLDALEVSKAACPDDVDLEEGVTFTCKVTASGTAVPVEVVLTDVESDDVTVKTTPKASLIPASAAAEFLKQQLPDDVASTEVTCADGDPILAIPGVAFSCTLALGSESNEVKLRVVDTDGSIERVS